MGPLLFANALPPAFKKGFKFPFYTSSKSHLKKNSLGIKVGKKNCSYGCLLLYLIRENVYVFGLSLLISFYEPFVLFYGLFISDKAFQG